MHDVSPRCSYVQQNNWMNHSHSVNTWLEFNIARQHGPFIDGLPSTDADFPWLCSFSGSKLQAQQYEPSPFWDPMSTACLQHVMIRCFACFTIFMLSLCVHDLVCDIPKNWEGIGHFFVDLDHPKCIRTMSEEPLLSVIVNGKTLSACKNVQQIFLRRNNGLPDLDCDPRGFLSRFWKQETWREICCRHEESYAKFYCTFLFCLYIPLIFCWIHFVKTQNVLGTSWNSIIGEDVPIQFPMPTIDVQSSDATLNLNVIIDEILRMRCDDMRSEIHIEFTVLLIHPLFCWFQIFQHFSG